MGFPKNFVWGAAAASYQVEGATFEDGKGASVWDAFCRWPGKVALGETGDVACDHYHRYEEDARLMAQIGLKAYRLSISWPRVLPEGVGRVNAKGLDFYSRLVDALLKHGIEPWVTLFHWDYPQELYLRGGWLNRQSPDWFAEYAGVIVDALSDRVTHWMTQNEPQCFIGLGHSSGEHAPGLKLGPRDVLLAAHHALLAHGRAVQVIRARTKRPAQVGAAPVGTVNCPATRDAKDIAAARTKMFSVTNPDVVPVWCNSWWMDPMFLGKYPEDGLALHGKNMPPMRAGDMETICQPLDFFGFNAYTSELSRAGAKGPEAAPIEAGIGATTMNWHVRPESLYWGAKFFHERYHLPIVVTENGMANTDWVALDGCVHDPQRIDFLQRYLREYRRAGDEGTPLIGYFQWSIMDNFEWAFGYRQRFGLIHVDYATQKRTPKDSARWYKGVIASNGANL